MTEEIQSPYKSPSAELINTDSNSQIHQFKRFSAWGVFFLSIITLSIYQIYWMYSRASRLNEIHENKIHHGWLIALVATTILSFVVGFLGESDIILALSGINTIAYLAIYITVLFKLRNRLQTIMSNSGNQTYRLNPVLTFFFNAIYLQFKTNQCIDENSKREAV